MGSDKTIMPAPFSEGKVDVFCCLKPGTSETHSVYKYVCTPGAGACVCLCPRSVLATEQTASAATGLWTGRPLSGRQKGFSHGDAHQHLCLQFLAVLHSVYVFVCLKLI